jgi:hypothetical protein
MIRTPSSQWEHDDMLNNTRLTGHKRPSAASVKGWLDYAQGRSFDPSYDSWPKSEQVNYELGRHRAANYELATKGMLPDRHVDAHTYRRTTDPYGREG